MKLLDNSVLLKTWDIVKSDKHIKQESLRNTKSGRFL